MNKIEEEIDLSSLCLDIDTDLTDFKEGCKELTKVLQEIIDIFE